MPSTNDSIRCPGCHQHPDTCSCKTHKNYVIEVHRELGGSNRYFITADTELDARVIAFCLDGGHSGNLVDQGIIELTKEWTTVL